MDRILSLGSTVNRADILAVLEQLYQAVEMLTLEGSRVNVAGIVEIFPRLQGVFNGVTDTYDPARHQAGVKAAVGARLREAVRQKAQVQKDEGGKPSPALLQYVDTGSGTVDGTVTKGNIGTLNGARMKFNPSAADEGIFFLPTGGGAAVKVAAVQRNKPAQLIFLVPATLAAGSYFLEVRARLTAAGDLRSGKLDDTLTVP